MLGAQAVVPRRHLEAEDRLEQKRCADAAPSQMVQHGQRSRLVVQPIGRHQEDARLSRGLDHRRTFRLGRGQRFLDQDMLARARRPDRIVGMHGVRQRDVDCIDRAVGQQSVIGLIGHHPGHAMKVCKLAALGKVARDNGRDHRIPGLRDARHEGFLRNPSRPDHRISDHPRLPSDCADPPRAEVKISLTPADKPLISIQLLPLVHRGQFQPTASQRPSRDEVWIVSTSVWMRSPLRKLNGSAPVPAMACT